MGTSPFLSFSSHGVPAMFDSWKRPGRPCRSGSSLDEAQELDRSSYLVVSPPEGFQQKMEDSLR